MFAMTEATGGRVCSSIPLHFIPLRQGLSVNLEFAVSMLGWWPASPRDPLVSKTLSNFGITGAHGYTQHFTRVMGCQTCFVLVCGVGKCLTSLLLVYYGFCF